VVPGAEYTLEVSSRTGTEALGGGEFARFQGSLVKVKTFTRSTRAVVDGRLADLRRCLKIDLAAVKRREEDREQGTGNRNSVIEGIFRF